MSIERIASDHDRHQRAISKRVAQKSAQLWGGLDRQFLDHSWNASIGPQIFAAVAVGQLAAATPSDAYLDTALAAQSIDPSTEGSVVPRSLSGIASDGRNLATLLYQPLIATKYAIGQGLGLDRAMAIGLASLDMIVRTQVADAGRVGVSVATTARRHAGGYVRMLNPPSCSRCAVLAGKWFHWNAGFARHPRCDCTQIPSSEDVAGDLATDPKAYFSSLSVADQNRLFTNAGAQAIRDGSDIGQVVNARRGMYTAGGRSLTREGTSTRGLYGGYEIDPETGVLKRRSGSRSGGSATPPRLTPEQIYADANGNRDEAIRLLRQFGYLR